MSAAVSGSRIAVISDQTAELSLVADHGAG
jgi:hypothetical protein